MNNNLFNIKDYVVVITGGTGVLGRTIAKYLALEGAKVAILGRKEEVGNAIVEDIKQAGGEASFFKTSHRLTTSLHTALCQKLKKLPSKSSTNTQSLPSLVRLILFSMPLEVT